MARDSVEQAGRMAADGPPLRSALAIVAVAFLVRVVAALVVQRLAETRHLLCLFDDTNVYWHLAGAIKSGQPYVVSQFGVPHFSLRMPGYPLVLALLRVVCGDARLPIRLIQAALASTSMLVLIPLVYKLASGVECVANSARSASLAAGWFAALEPWSAGMSVLLLSEALFMPILIWSLAGFASLWCASNVVLAPRVWWSVIISTSLANAFAIALRPSWVLFPIIAIAGWTIWSRKGGRAAALWQGLTVLFLIAVVLSPWWYRNARLYGKFAPTALWFGASLYDGMNAEATGASDMRFLERPEFRTLDEQTQDRVLRERSIEFARAHPLRVLELAVIKAGRYWSPWPNADEIASPPLRIASAFATLPMYALILWGCWLCRGDVRTLVLLLGPAVYIASVHMIFVGSMRYRIPVMVPALGLAGMAAVVLIKARGGRGQP